MHIPDGFLTGQAALIGTVTGVAGLAVCLRGAARTMRDLVLGRETDLTRLPWVGNPPRNWEPEPLRFVGARGIYSLYRVADRQERIRDHESRIAGLANRIAGR